MLRKALVVAALAAAALPGAAAAQRGVVVKVERPAHLIAVAGARGTVSLVHTTAAPRLHVGQRVSFSARTLRNRTLAATRFVVVGSVHRLQLRGFVLAHRSGGFVLSAHGALLLIHPRLAQRATASASDGTPPPPAVGSEVQVTATVGQSDDLEEQSVASLGAAQNAAVEGKIVSLATGSIVVGNDGMQVTIAVPAGFDLSKFAVGDEVLAFVSRQADGTFLLTALSANGDSAEADDSQAAAGNPAQADQQVEQEDNGDTSAGDDGSGGDAQSGDDHGSASTPASVSGSAGSAATSPSSGDGGAPNGGDS